MTRPEVIADFWEFYGVKDIQAELTPAQYGVLFIQARPCFRIKQDKSGVPLSDQLLAALLDITIMTAPKKKKGHKHQSILAALMPETEEQAAGKKKHRRLTREELEAL